MSDPKGNLQFFLLSSTHWDREWYLPFQAFRFKLAETLDEVLDVMEAQPDFQLFCMDGQTVVLDDYMGAAPENRVRLQKLIDSGRIKIGPWYVMPDTRLASGESLILNFLMGRRAAGRWNAETWKYGYMCDIFGHIAQMPQLLNGFGFTGAYLGRGLRPEWRGLFRWQGPDGSETLTYYDCYGHFTHNVSYKYGTPEYEEALRSYVGKCVERNTSPVVVLADAFDHTRITPQTNAILADIQKLYPDAQVRHESLELVSAAAQPYRDSLPLIQGELIETTADRRKSMRVVGQSISSYYPVKYRNDRCQNLLEKLVLPLNALARLNGMKDRPALVETCIDYLMKNQPHDSICGCSVDQVHIDMTYRYDQVEEIGGELLARSCQALWTQDENGEDCIEILNPFPYAWTASVRAEVPFATDYAAKWAESAGYEPRNAFRLYDGEGREVPYQLHGIRKKTFVRIEAQKTAPAEMYDLSFQLPLSAMGSTRLAVRPTDLPVRFDSGSLRCAPTSCDNGLIRLDIAADGTLTLTDHETGEVYNGLNRFVDDGDLGNGWFRDAPVGDVLRQATTPVRVERLSAGPAQAAFRIIQKLPLPLSWHSDAQTALELETTATVWAGERYVQLDVKLVNTATDHRLRVQFPIGEPMENYESGQAFYCAPRHAGIAEGGLDLDEVEELEKSFNGILRASNGSKGLAFVSPYGLHAGGVDSDGTISVTLLRSFSYFHMAEKPLQASRLIGEHHYRYAIMPVKDSDGYADLVRLQEQLAVQLPLRHHAGTPGSDMPLVQLDGENLLMSLIKAPEDQAEDTLVVRLWNASDRVQSGALHTAFTLAQAERVALDERFGEAVPFTAQTVELNLKPWEIVTLKLCKVSS